MKFFRLDLLTLLISLFIFSGCNKQTGIGLDPDQKLTGSLYEYNDIVVNTMNEDPVVTSDTTGYTRSPLAYINDPVLGTTQSSLALGLNLPGSTAYTLPTGTITVDSAVLVLRYAQGFYGDSLATRYKADVYQLASNPDVTKNYHATDTWSTLPTLLGTKTFNARPNTRVSITDIVTGGKDTAKLVAPQIRIPISTAFINNNLFRATSTQLSSVTEFQKAIKGLYVKLDPTQLGSSTGGAMMLALTDSSSVDVYYRTNDGNGTIDTAIVQMPFSKFAAEIKRTPSAAVTAAIANQSTSNSTFYLQGMGGLKAKISFPNLKNIATQAGGSIVINRADLVITPAPGTTVPLAPQPAIIMYQWDIAKQRTFLQDDNTSDPRYLDKSVFGGFYTTDGSYHFIITGYIQDLMLGKTIDYGTYLGVTDETNTSQQPATTDFAPTPQVAGRLVAVGSQTSASSNYPYRIKLNVIYTKVNSGK